jgi:hypothetical protein
MNRRPRSARFLTGIQGEERVLKLLKTYGRSCDRQFHQDPFDILVDGWRVDVKTAVPVEYHGGYRWLFNLHHGGRPITGCDFFVLRLEDVPFSVRPVHLLLGAPFPTLTVAVTVQSLKCVWPLYAAKFFRFLLGEYGIRPGGSIT